MSAIMKGSATAVVAPKDRAAFVTQRMKELSKDMAEGFIELGYLLKEYKDNAYFKEDGYESFDDGVNAMYTAGELDFQSRNARNAISVVEMLGANGLKPEDVKKIAPSKLRELATLPPAEQKKLLPKAGDMTVAEVQQTAKEIRHKARGHDVDPFDPIILKDSTATMKTAFNSAIAHARRIYQVPEEVSDSKVLIDHILAEWSSCGNCCPGAGEESNDAIDIEAKVEERIV